MYNACYNSHFSIISWKSRGNKNKNGAFKYTIAVIWSNILKTYYS